MDRIVRLIVAFAGGGFLVIPMLVMTIHQPQTKSLITASLSVVLFGIAISFGVRTNNVETLVATATYAAVLVICRLCSTCTTCALS